MGNQTSKNISLIAEYTFIKVHSNTFDNKILILQSASKSSLLSIFKILPSSWTINNHLNIDHLGSKQSIITSIQN